MLINRPLRYCRYISTVTYSTPSVLLQLCSDELKNYQVVILKYTVQASAAGTKRRVEMPTSWGYEQDGRDIDFVRSIMGLNHSQVEEVEVVSGHIVREVQFERNRRPYYTHIKSCVLRHHPLETNSNTFNDS
jgi:hypothetical protein